jgi:hypothetical protein
MERQFGRSMLALCAVLLVSTAPAPAGADVSSDRASAILIFPKIQTDDAPTVDTIVQISNTSDEPQALHCFYVNATSHCSFSGNACDISTNPCPIEEGFCQPGWIETDFFVYITPRQPLAWLASRGMSEGPLDGDIFVGPEGDSNEGTRVPPVPETSFVGELKCIVVDQDERPTPRNVVKGEATITRVDGDDVDTAKYNAVGLQAIDADADENRILVLGGGANEYAGCPQTLIVDHVFDFALNPVGGDPITSTIALVPCTQDLLNQIPGGTTAQYLVLNEFEQRFSTSTPVDCYFEKPLSLIDTTNRPRSIFSAFVAGSFAGQTRVRGVTQGLMGVLVTRSGDATAAANLHTQGDREQPDFITLP